MRLFCCTNSGFIAPLSKHEPACLFVGGGTYWHTLQGRRGGWRWSRTGVLSARHRAASRCRTLPADAHTPGSTRSRPAPAGLLRGIRERVRGKSRTCHTADKEPVGEGARQKKKDSNVKLKAGVLWNCIILQDSDQTVDSAKPISEEPKMSGQTQSLLTTGEFLNYSTEKTVKQFSDKQAAPKDAWLTRRAITDLSSFKTVTVVRTFPPRHINMDITWQMWGMTLLPDPLQQKLNPQTINPTKVWAEQASPERPHTAAQPQRSHSHTAVGPWGWWWWQRWLCLDPERRCDQCLPADIYKVWSLMSQADCRVNSLWSGIRMFHIPPPCCPFPLPNTHTSTPSFSPPAGVFQACGTLRSHS